MGRLRIVLMSAALVAGFALGGPVRADEVTEDLPWWAQPESEDYEEQAANLAAALDAVPDVPEVPEAVEAPVDPGWWAGGPDAVLVLAGGETPSEEFEQEIPEGSSNDAAEEHDDGRSPLFSRAGGHRAGEDPAGTSGEGSDPILEEERDKEGTNECKRLPTQIARYKRQLDLAGNRISKNGRSVLESQIDRLEERQKRRCPQSIGPSTFDKAVAVSARLLVKAVRIGARVARYMYGSPF